MSDFELLARYAAGDSTALDQLWFKYRSRLTAHARSILSSSGMQRFDQDVVQDVFVQLIRKASELTTSLDSSLHSWLFTVTRNMALGMKRKRQGNELQPEQVYAPETPEDFDLEKLRGCLDVLPEQFQSLIHLYYYSECTTEQIAKDLGKKKRTIQLWLQRSRQMLLHCLERNSAQGKI